MKKEARDYMKVKEVDENVLANVQWSTLSVVFSVVSSDNQHPGMPNLV